MKHRTSVDIRTSSGTEANDMHPTDTRRSDRVPENAPLSSPPRASRTAVRGCLENNTLKACLLDVHASTIRTSHSSHDAVRHLRCVLPIHQAQALPHKAKQPLITSTASQDLKRAFASFLETPSQRALLAHITSNPDQISPGKTIPSSTTPLAKDLDNVAAALGDNEAAYVLLQDDKGKAVAVTYVPLTAPVRSKMLYSSSSLTLARDLGGPFRSPRGLVSNTALTACRTG